MRDADTGIEVFIDPQPYGPEHTEYNVPLSSTTARDSPNTRYIEAITDEEYIICISLPQKRKREPAAWVTCVTIHIDDVLVAQRLLSAGEAHGTIEFARADALGHDFSLSFAFGELFIDPAIQHTEEEDFKEISRRGKIVVCSTSRLPDKRARKRSQSVFYKSHKKLTDDPNGIGKATTFTFFYVSKDILERRNLVPEAPTRRPPPTAPVNPLRRPPSGLQAPGGRPVFPIFLSSQAPTSDFSSGRDPLLSKSSGAGLYETTQGYKSNSTGTQTLGSNFHSARLPPKRSRPTTSHSKRQKIIDYDGDDEEPLPQRAIKQETVKSESAN